MQRLTPDNPKVVKYSMASTPPLEDYDDLIAITPPMFYFQNDDFRPGSRIRITAEVIEPEKEAQYE